MDVRWIRVDLWKSKQKSEVTLKTLILAYYLYAIMKLFNEYDRILHLIVNNILELSQTVLYVILPIDFNSTIF